MSRVSISKSYAVLVGIESYTKTKKKIASAQEKVGSGAEKIMNPEEAKRKVEQEKDKSESAEKERQWLERQRREEAEKAEEGKMNNKEQKDKVVRKLMQKLGLANEKDEAAVVDAEVAKYAKLPDVDPVPGTSVESGVPAPEGER